MKQSKSSFSTLVNVFGGFLLLLMTLPKRSWYRFELPTQQDDLLLLAFHQHVFLLALGLEALKLVLQKGVEQTSKSEHNSAWTAHIQHQKTDVQYLRWHLTFVYQTHTTGKTRTAFCRYSLFSLMISLICLDSCVLFLFCSSFIWRNKRTCNSKT